MATISSYNVAYLSSTSYSSNQWAWTTNNQKPPPSDYSTLTRRCCVSSGYDDEAYVGRLEFVPGETGNSGRSKYLTIKVTTRQSRPCNIQAIFNNTSSCQVSGGSTYASGIPSTSTGTFSESYIDEACTTRVPNNCYEESGTVYFKLDLTNYTLTSGTTYYVFFRAAGHCTGNSAKSSTLWDEPKSKSAYTLTLTYSAQYTLKLTAGIGTTNVTRGGTFESGSWVTVSASVLPGYTWSGWTGTTTQSLQSFNVLMNRDHSLTANATPNIYTVTLNNQGATTSGTTMYYYTYNTNNPYYYYEDIGCTTALNDTGQSIICPTRTGYTFNGYCTQPDGGGIMYVDADGNCINNIYSTETTDTTLYAHWIANTYTVTLNNQSATVAGTTAYYYQYNTTKTINGVLTYYYSDSTLTTPLTEGYKIVVPQRTGYRFLGYYTGTDGSGTKYVESDGTCINSIYSAVAGNTTLYAQWEVLATMFVKVNSTYKPGIPWIKVDGDWKRASAVYIKVDGDWKLSTR